MWAGAYKFNPKTWDLVSNTLGLPDFKPYSQDQAALFLINRRGALGLVDRGELTPEVLSRLPPEWVSIPSKRWRSLGDVSPTMVEELQRFYTANLSQLRQGSSEQQAY